MTGSAILIVVGAAFVAWMFGAAYYGLLGPTWVAAQGRTMDEMKSANARKSGAEKAFPFVLSLIAEIVMAAMMSGLLAHMKMVTLRGGLVTGLVVWFGFVLTTVWVNNAYTGRGTMLTAIDAGHWLGVLLIIGIVVGGLG